jgi:hypothetical protein
MGTDVTVLHVFKNRFSLHLVHNMASDIMQHLFNTGSQAGFQVTLILKGSVLPV